MNELADVLFWLEILGVIAFSISGAMVAIEEQLDLFGVLFLGMVTALGGGVLRDTFLGNVPSPNFFNYRCILLSLITGGIVFLIAYVKREYYFSHTEIIERVNNAIDAAGLGVFSVFGVQITKAADYYQNSQNFFLLIFMGMLTGVGGGLLRDTIACRKPLIFSKHIYAIASILGCLCYLGCLEINVRDNTAVVISILVVFLIRMVSARLKLDLPKIRR